VRRQYKTRSTPAPTRDEDPTFTKIADGALEIMRDGLRQASKRLDREAKKNEK
jgi:hypothetical protein